MAGRTWAFSDFELYDTAPWLNAQSFKKHSVAHLLPLMRLLVDCGRDLRFQCLCLHQSQPSLGFERLLDSQVGKGTFSRVRVVKMKGNIDRPGRWDRCRITNVKFQRKAGASSTAHATVCSIAEQCGASWDSLILGGGVVISRIWMPLVFAFFWPDSDTIGVLTSSIGWVGYCVLERACWCHCRVLPRCWLSEWRVRFGAGLLVAQGDAAGCRDQHTTHHSNRSRHPAAAPAGQQASWPAPEVRCCRTLQDSLQVPLPGRVLGCRKAGNGPLCGPTIPRWKRDLRGTRGAGMGSTVWTGLDKDQLHTATPIRLAANLPGSGWESVRKLIHADHEGWEWLPFDWWHEAAAEDPTWCWCSGEDQRALPDCLLLSECLAPQQWDNAAMHRPTWAVLQEARGNESRDQGFQQRTVDDAADLSWTRCQRTGVGLEILRQPVRLWEDLPVMGLLFPKAAGKMVRRRGLLGCGGGRTCLRIRQLWRPNRALPRSTLPWPWMMMRHSTMMDMKTMTMRLIQHTSSPCPCLRCPQLVHGVADFRNSAACCRFSSHQRP